MKEFVTVQLSEKDWTFRALDLDQIESLEDQFIAVSGLGASAVTMPKEGVQAVAEIACESLKFKHPDITVAQCRKVITLGTVPLVMDAVRGVSALEPVPGEARAGMA